MNKMNSIMPRRFLFIFFPFFSAESIVVQRKELSKKPILVSYSSSGTSIVYSVNKLASDLGIYPNMTIADALNIQKECFIAKKNTVGEDSIKKHISKKLSKFSPWISKSKKNSLLLNITGCSHLFGGEELMAKEILFELKNMGFNSNIGIGNSSSAAMAAAIFKKNYKSDPNILLGNYIKYEARTTRFKSKIRLNAKKYICENNSYQILGKEPDSFMSELPINLLDLTNREFDELYFLGLKKLADLSKLKKSGIVEYFGKDLLDKLNTTLGVRDDPISPLQEEYDPIYCKEFLYQIVSKDNLVLEIKNIIKIIISRLEYSDRLVKKLVITLSYSLHKKTYINLELSTATKDINLITSLVKFKIEDIKLPSSIKKLTVLVTKTEKNNLLQPDMIHSLNTPIKTTDIEINEKYIESISKISVRVGRNNIQKIYLKNTHIPEKVTSLIPTDEKTEDNSWKKSLSALRPIYVFSPKKIEIEKFKNSSLPKACVWGGVKRWISAAFGPEIVAPEWWQENSSWESHTRNYWIIELTEGEKLWIFELRNGKFANQWYIHGNFC